MTRTYFVFEPVVLLGCPLFLFEAPFDIPSPVL